jgi:very-short-patch-repair endonuclease
MAQDMPEAAFKRRVNEARRAEILTVGDLADVTDRFPRHPGTKLLRPLLEVKGGPTRSEWEDAFPAWCRRHRLPSPVMSAVVAGYEVDALFPHEKVIVELDSWEYHKDRTSFESDRERDAATLAAGYVTVRITWGRMTAAEAARLQAILDSRRPRPA